MYQERERNRRVIHLHATHSVAVSVLEGLDPDDLLPPLTAYYVMRIGTLPLVPYYAPGDMALAEAVRGYAGRHHALLLANHGPVVAGSTLAAAADAVEELEATAETLPAAAGPACPPAHPRPGCAQPWVGVLVVELEHRAFGQPVLVVCSLYLGARHVCLSVQGECGVAAVHTHRETDRPEHEVGRSEQHCAAFVREIG